MIYCTCKTLYYKHSTSRPIKSHHTVVNNQINPQFDQSARRTYIYQPVTQQLMKCAEKTYGQTTYNTHEYVLFLCHLEYSQRNYGVECGDSAVLVQMIIVVLL